jgi:hypothetical protein
VTPQSAAAITVSGGTFTSARTDTFDVVGSICVSDCKVTDGLGLTGVDAKVPSGGKILITFESTPGSSACGGTLGRVGSSITIDPRIRVPTQATFRWTKAAQEKAGRANVGVTHFVLCWSKPDDPSSQLRKCDDPLAAPTCELKRNRTGVGDLEIVVRLAPFDPQFDLG